MMRHLLIVLIACGFHAFNRTMSGGVLSAAGTAGLGLVKHRKPRRDFQMDGDLDDMSRAQLIAEVRRLRDGIGGIGTVRARSFAGITPRCGVCCPRSQIPFLLCRSGRNSWQGVSDIAHLLIHRHPMRRVAKSHTATTMPDHSVTCSR